MRYQTSSEFEAYARTLRRVFWSEFIDRQMGTMTSVPATQADTQSATSALAVYPPIPNNGTAHR